MMKTLLTSAALSAVVLPTALSAAPENFTLKGYDDQATYELKESQGRYVALHFLLKTECPVCLRYTREYYVKSPLVAGVDHVFIKPDSPDDIAMWVAKLDLTDAPTIYRDPEAKLADAYKVPSGFEFHGEVVHYPTLLILDTEGKEVFRYVGKNNSDRFSFPQFQGKMAELTNTPALKHYNLSRGQIALQGYDPVSYRQGEPQRGVSQRHSSYRGIAYLFTSEENRATFTADPEAYIPAYGGWCATGVAMDKKLDIDPMSYKIIDGKLHLFFKNKEADAKAMWLENEEANQKAAKENWKRWVGQ